jgi:hypothetical protein
MKTTSEIPLLVVTRLKHAFLSLLPSFIQHQIDAFQQPPTRKIFSKSYLDHLRRLAALFVFTLLSLFPSFIQHRIDPSRKPPLGKIFPTSYLDDLRGLAALFVFWYHVDGKYLNSLMPSYGLPLSEDGTRAPSSILQLPFLRVAFSGRPMVHIFFIISGYALSLKSLKQIRSNENTALLGTVSSALFRRGIRLFLPIVASTFIGSILLQMNYRCCAAPTFPWQMWEWYDELSKALNFWYPDGRDAVPHDPHLWAIPIEMSNSVVLFAVLIALARCKVVIRMILLVSTMLICMRVGQWVASEFLMGMFFAELGLIQEDLDQYFTSSETIALVVRGEEAMSLLSDDDGEEKDEGNEPAHHQYQIRRRRRQLQEVKRIGSIVLKVFCILNLIFALWLAGWPEEHPEQDAGI